jgi:heat shock protein HslJ
MRRTVFRLALALYALALAGCAAPDATTGETLANTAWVAESIDGKPVLPDARSTLRFFDRQYAGGSLGCNAYSTTYFTSGGGLRFGAIAPTNNACAPEVMEQEARFRAVLEATRSVRHEQSGMLLIDGEGRARVKLDPLKP